MKPYEASVIFIFKKGDSSKFENDRPIALLQTFYMLLAAMLKNRLAEGLETFLMKTQSVSEKATRLAMLFCLQGTFKALAEVSGKAISIVLLDWEKAFDRIDHARLLESMRRLEIPTNIYNIISDIYIYMPTPNLR